MCCSGARKENQVWFTMKFMWVTVQTKLDPVISEKESQTGQIHTINSEAIFDQIKS